jgi:CitMHS family citrate-Mg2+:H+ or citrate-Ca2+:H+ symporter
MSLSFWGFFTILALLIATLSKKVSPLIALFSIPILGAVAAGFRLQIGLFILDGIRSVSSVIGMFVFAILFFGAITDAKVLEPIFDWILFHIGERPTRIVPASAMLALLVHLDGSGAVVFLVTIPALLPLYERVGIDRRILACVTSLAAGVNFLPWTGPTLRASTALHLSPIDIFRPILRVQIVGLLFVFGVSYWLGRREERRLKHSEAGAQIQASVRERKPFPPRFVPNVILVLIVLAGAISGLLDPVIVFMGGTMCALLLNFPTPKQQQGRLTSHAPAAMLMCTILFSAGAFSGILKGTGMLNAMGATAARHISPGAARHMPFALGLLSMPLSQVFDPDSFYLGVLPLLARVAASFGIPAIEVAQAALLGQMTTGFPVSVLTPATFLVLGLTGISLGDHQRFSAPYLFGASVVMTIAAVAFGVFPF